MFKKLLQPFRFAFQGLDDVFRNERNARIHVVFAVFAAFLGLFLNISTTEWAILAVCIGLVISMEAMNTALERLTDLVSPAQNPLAGRAKDAAAGAVLIAALTAVAAGIFIFLPKLLALFSDF